MKASEAVEVLAILTAGFPDQALEPPTVELWSKLLMKMGGQRPDAGAIGRDVAIRIVETWDRFPKLAQYRQMYIKHQLDLKQGQLERYTGPPEPVPEQVKEWMAKIGWEMPS